MKTKSKCFGSCIAIFVFFWCGLSISWACQPIPRLKRVNIPKKSNPIISTAEPNTVKFSVGSRPQVGVNFKYTCSGCEYPYVSSNFWGKRRMTYIGLIRYLNGKMSFTFKGKKHFTIMAAGGALGGKSHSNVDIYVNGKKIASKFFLNQWWNNYTIPESRFKHGTNTVSIVNVSPAVPWLYKATLSNKLPAKTRILK